MPGRFSLYQDLTVEENLQFFATTFGTDIATNYHLVADIYKQIEPFKTRRAGKLSGGMKQRIVIAMALIAEPELLLADEPTTALDVTIQAQILELMKDLKEKFNSAVILITHDLGVVAEFCDAVAVVYSGRVVEIGKVEDIFGEGNNHPYTKGLINCIPDLTSTATRLSPIAGRMGDPRIKVQGCCFAERCPHASEKCKTTPPPMVYENDHGILCHLFSKEGI